MTRQVNPIALGIGLAGGILFSLAMPHQKTLGGIGFSLLLIGWLPGVLPFMVLGEPKTTKTPPLRALGLLLAATALALPFAPIDSQALPYVLLAKVSAVAAATFLMRPWQSPVPEPHR